jgi:hypothetical protein
MSPCSAFHVDCTCVRKNCSLCQTAAYYSWAALASARTAVHVTLQCIPRGLPLRPLELQFMSPCSAFHVDCTCVRKECSSCHTRAYSTWNAVASARTAVYVTLQRASRGLHLRPLELQFTCHTEVHSTWTAVASAYTAIRVTL